MRARTWSAATAAALIALSVSGGGARGGSPPLSEREILVRSVDRWDGGCSGSDRSPTWSEMAWFWRWGMILGPVDVGPTAGWKTAGSYVGGNIVDSDFTDVNKVAWGKDHTVDRADDADAVMITMHGGNAGSDSRWVGSVRVDENGPGDCGTCQREMDFGDQDAEFVHLSSCFSMDEADWHPRWSSSLHGVHQVLGFHGIMYIRGSLRVPYQEFAQDAFDIPISFSWLDHTYSPAVDENDEPKDQCPVARATGLGATGDDCWQRLTTERYSDVDPVDPDSPTWHCVIAIDGCDPSGGPPIGSP